MRWLVLMAWVALLTCGASRAEVYGSAYVARGQCGPNPRAALNTPDGTCTGIAAGPAQGLKMPRLILALDRDTLIITDMAGWGSKKGRVLKATGLNAPVLTITTLLSGLDQVHGLALGSDGKVYVGETGKISRFAPGSRPVSLEPVVTDLPRDGLHPLTTMIFDAQGALIVNIGAPTDRCELKGPGQDKPQDPCPFLAGTKPRAALWRLTFDKPGGKVVKTEVLATGLRNSMALAVDGASGTVLQAENSADLPGENEPPEEINLIKQNKNYGWPHCVGANQPLLGTIPASRCKGLEPAAVLLPAHAAPLGMLIYRSDTLPGLKGRLVVGYHGYRDNGHRIVSFALPDVLNAKQNALSMSLVSGWQRQKGLRPRGAPVGLAEAADGTLWFVEDKNRTIMAIRADDAPGGRSLDMPPPSDKPSQARPMPKGFDTLARDLLSRKCVTCHVEMREKDPAKAWGRIVDAGWAEPGPLRETKLIASMLGDQGHKPMPPPLGLKADAAARKLIEEFLGRNP